MQRRSFLGTMAAGAVVAAPSAVLVEEFTFTSRKQYADPFHDVTVDVLVTGPDGQTAKVPAFWAGGNQWKVRWSGGPGTYRLRTVATDETNPMLHGVTATRKSAGTGPRQGRLRVAAGKRHFEHADGTPFFWLGDTWWMGLCNRLHWDGEFQRLAADRVAKGYTVIQIIAGLYPDMPPFDPRGANEAGYPWKEGYAGLNPEYFNLADRRIQHLVSMGLTPCIVGCWGYFLPLMGEEKMKQHWRNLIARWGAYPVVWCLAGEGTMPYYLSKTPKEDSAAQKKGWTEIARYVRAADPFHNVITIHPSSTARESVEDETVIDFDMLQTGHSDRNSYANTVKRVTGSLEKSPKMPVLVGEVCYEGIMAANREEVQRFVFWSSILSGAAGHTYGANGLWQLNRAEKPFGPSPHGRNWGTTPWNVASELPGGRHLGVAAKFLQKLEWWRMEPHPEWVDPHWTQENFVRPYAAGIPGKLRVVFTPAAWNPPKVKSIEAGVKYTASFFDVTTGEETAIGPVTPDAAGDWTPPLLPTFADWVIVLRA